MGLLDILKKGFTKKRSVNSKKKSKKRSTLVFKNVRTDKYFKVPNKTFTLQEFNEKYDSRTTKIPFFKKGTGPKTHLQIMFDPDAPKGTHSFFSVFSCSSVRFSTSSSSKGR